MQYVAAHFTNSFAEEFMTDLFIASLAELGFESFEDNLTAYIPEPNFSREKLDNLINTFPYKGAKMSAIELIADHDWNEEWERNYFKPIIIADKCVIHSSFHNDIPPMPYDIIIDPRMAFGTGHHATTSLIINTLLDMDLKHKKVLDMGCGTAVLAILASMRGAEHVTAIDIDDRCTDNAMTNIKLNNITNVTVELGDANLLEGRHFDLIIANINRNILLMDIPAYTACLDNGGQLIISGFYTDDVQILEHKLQECHAKIEEIRERDNWAMVRAIKH